MDIRKLTYILNMFNKLNMLKYFILRNLQINEMLELVKFFNRFI